MGKIALLAFSVYVASVAYCLASELKKSEAGFAYVNVGFIGVFYDESADVYIAGTQVAGLDLEFDNDLTGGLELGYRFGNDIAASVMLGLPPSVTVYGNDLLPAKVGSITYGAVVASAHYHFTHFGPRFEPYIGGGVAYTVVLNEQDGALNDLDVENAFGPVLQFGFESRLNDRWGLFVDFKKVWLDTTARGTINELPARADVSFDPFVTMVGVSYRF